MNGADFKQAVKTMGMTQAAFAQWVGWSPEHMSRVVRGRKPVAPHVRVLVRIALRLHQDGIDPREVAPPRPAPDEALRSRT